MASRSAIVEMFIVECLGNAAGTLVHVCLHVNVRSMVNSMQLLCSSDGFLWDFVPERAVFKLCSGVGLGVDWSSVSDSADWGRNEYLKRCWDWGKFNSCLVIGSFQPIVALVSCEVP